MSVIPYRLARVNHALVTVASSHFSTASSAYDTGSRAFAGGKKVDLFSTIHRFEHNGESERLLMPAAVVMYRYRSR